MQKNELIKVIGALLLIAFVSLWPSSGDGIEIFPNADKPGHFLMYFFLCFLLVRTRNPKAKNYFKSSMFIAAGFSLYGLIMEILQEAMPFGRTFEWADAVANTIGAFSGMLLAAVFKKCKINTRRQTL